MSADSEQTEAVEAHPSDVVACSSGVVIDVQVGSWRDDAPELPEDVTALLAPPVTVMLADRKA